MPLLNNPRESGSGGSWLNPFGDNFPETPPPLAPGALPEVQANLCSCTPRMSKASISGLARALKPNACLHLGLMHTCLGMHKIMRPPPIVQVDIRQFQRYLKREAVAYDQFLAARNEGDGSRFSMADLASGEVFTLP